MRRLRDGLRACPDDAEHAVESVWLTISMIVGHPAALVADEPAAAPSSSISLDAFDRLPQLVLEPLDRDAVARAVRHAGGARGSTTARPRRLREHQERVAHRRGAEPLVPGEPVRLARAGAVDGTRPTWCSPARPTRPASRSWPSRRSPRPSSSPAIGRVVARVRESRLPYRRPGSGSARNAGNDRVRHRHRASMARIDLAPHHETGGPSYVAARPADRATAPPCRPVRARRA